MRYLPVAAFLGLSLLWGSEWMLTTFLSAQPHLRILAIQYGIGAALLLPYAIRRRLWRKSTHLVANAIISGIGILCLPQILIFAGKEALSPAIPLVAMAMVPLFLAISGRLLINTAVCGLAGVLFLADRDLTLSIHQLPWLLLPLTGAGVLAWALTHAEKKIREISIAETLFAQFTVSALLLLTVSELLERETVIWSATAAIAVAVNAILVTVCGYLLFYWLLRKLGAAHVSTLQWTQPLFATVEFTLLMRIRPDWTTILGAIVVMIAIMRTFSKWDSARGVLFEITQK
jgi:drug/metabolite transporter (DMT)-like permease